MARLRETPLSSIDDWEKEEESDEDEEREEEEEREYDFVL